MDLDNFLTFYLESLRSLAWKAGKWKEKSVREDAQLSVVRSVLWGRPSVAARVSTFIRLFDLESFSYLI